MVESSGNVFLNLSDTPLPAKYPLPPSDWTVLQGAGARAYWTTARDEWVAEHADMAIAGDYVPPVTPEDPDEPEAPTLPPASTFDGADFEGDNSEEVIVGNALDNFIDGNGGGDDIDGGAGNDRLRGDDGADLLRGGAGDDVFLFKRNSDSDGGRGVETILDFGFGDDRIDLGGIDANWSVSGNQAFALVSGEPARGQLRAQYDASTDTTVVTGNMDADRAAELTIRLAGEQDLTANDFIL
jgi:hypothetical protein